MAKIRPRGRPLWRPWLLILAGLALCWVVFSLSFTAFKSAELTRAMARTRLYQAVLSEALDRFQHLPFVLAEDPALRAAVAGQPAGDLNARLAEYARRAGVDALYVMDRTGLTVAASNYDQPLTFLGQSYGFRPYFKAAMEGRQGEFFAIGATTARPGYFIAAGVPGPGGRGIQGVVALKIDLGALTGVWDTPGEKVFVANADGVIVLASDPALRYRTLAPLSPARRAAVDAARQFAGEPLAPLDWRPGRNSEVRLNGIRFLEVTTPLPRLGWSLYFLTDIAPIRQRALLTALAMAALLGGAYAGYLLIRARRVRQALRVSQADRVALRSINRRLEREIEERRRAERRLARTQSELDRASRLAALGRLAASVTHELGQPISAMRTYLTAEEIGAESGDRMLLARLGGLIARMENITRQLRFFATDGGTPAKPVEMKKVIEGALGLVRHDLDAAGITPQITTPEAPVIVTGDRLRLEQVLVNLLRNAQQALAETGATELKITLETEGDQAILSVRDRGAGFGARSIEELSEPFHTSRPSGEGMGLGLAISAAIMEDHGGTLRASSRAGGGARFDMILPLTEEAPK